MDFYIDVRVHRNRTQRNGRFLFNTLTHGHDVYYCPENPGPSVIFFDSGGVVYIASLGTAGIAIGERVQYDPDYIKRVLRYAVIKFYIPFEFVEWMETFR